MEEMLRELLCKLKLREGHCLRNEIKGTSLAKRTEENMVSDLPR